MFQSVSKNVSYLAELGEEVGHAVLAVPELAEGERDEHGGEEVGEGVVQVGVLRQPAPALQQREQRRPVPRSSNDASISATAPALSSTTSILSTFFFPTSMIDPSEKNP